jgi:hypothetical protein
VESTAERGQPIGHPLQAGTVRGGRGVKPGSVVGDGELEARSPWARFPLATKVRAAPAIAARTITARTKMMTATPAMVKPRVRCASNALVPSAMPWSPKLNTPRSATKIWTHPASRKASSQR